MRLGGAGTFGATTADLVREDLLAADPNQGFGLEFEGERQEAGGQAAFCSELSV